MKVFVTGATGFIGSVTTDLLLAEGHEVSAIARSDDGIEKLLRKGVKAEKADLSSLDVIKRQAAAADGVIHLAFIHDFTIHDQAIKTELRVVSAILDALSGSNKPFLATSGSAAFGDRPDEPDESTTPPSENGRIQGERIVLEGAKMGVRTASVRLPMYVFGDDGAAFSKIQEAKAKEIGYVAYVGSGTQCSSVIHVKDAAALYLKALLLAKPGSIFHATDGRVPARKVAEAIAAKTGLSVKSVTPEEARTIYMPFFATLFGANVVADSQLTRRELSWQPHFTPELFLQAVAGKTVQAA